jgi:single-strand DNA-binding protein
VGRLKQDRWEDPEGKTRSKVHIVAEHVEFKPKFKREDEDSTETHVGGSEADDAVDFPEQAMEAAS